VLLDFPAPGALPSTPAPLRNAQDIQDFLAQVAQSATAPRTPLHARDFLSVLSARRFEAAAVIAGNLRALLHKPATFTRQRRLISILLPTACALAFALLTVATISQANRDFDRLWAKRHPGTPSLRDALSVFETAPLSDAEREQLSIHVAGHFAEAIQDQSFWNEPKTLAALDQYMRWFALDSIARHPQVSATDLSEADQKVAHRLSKMAKWNRALPILLPPVLFVAFLEIFLLAGALFAPFVRAPFAIWLMGGIVTTADGAPASRLRALARSLWLLVPLAPGAIALLLFSEEGQWIAAVSLTAFSIVTLLIASIWAVRRPERGLPDLLTGTYLLPR
jgi:hypothetical protein